MPAERCAQEAQLAYAVVDAVSKVYVAKRNLEAARGHSIPTDPFIISLQNSRAEELKAVAALDKHKKEHGCGVKAKKFHA